LAGLGARFLGLLLDSILYGLLGAVFAVPGVLLIAASSIGWAIAPEDQTQSPQSPRAGRLIAGIALVSIGLLLIAVLYVRSLGRTGQTWGRRLAGVRVVDKNSGAPIGIGRALGRTVFEQLISQQLLLLGYLWGFWDKDRQTWHDKVVNSIVVAA
jgi:uncharacterized RDD family membrane protein YckC